LEQQLLQGFWLDFGTLHAVSKENDPSIGVLAQTLLIISSAGTPHY